MRPTKILTFAALMFLVGCNPRDTEGLARVGKKVVARAGSAAEPLWERVDPGVRGLRHLAGVKDRVQARLQWDKQLAKVNIEVHSSAGEIELKGTIQNNDQRRRAVELAETTEGVERVTDNLQLE